MEKVVGPYDILGSHSDAAYNVKNKISPVTGLEWPRGFQDVKVPTFHDNGTGSW